MNSITSKALVLSAGIETNTYGSGFPMNGNTNYFKDGLTCIYLKKRDDTRMLNRLFKSKG
jgi:hypothetical protein